MRNVLSSLKNAVEVGANVLTIFGGLLGLYAIAHPETIATYLDRISGDVGAIAESIPRWPVIESVAYQANPPLAAAITVELSNPRNVLVKEFFGTASFELNGQNITLPLGPPAIIPPNEDVALKNNFIREDWFPELEDQAELAVQLCFGGRLEGSENRFYETRKYLLKPKREVLTLTERTFSSASSELCEQKLAQK